MLLLCLKCLEQMCFHFVYKLVVLCSLLTIGTVCFAVLIRGFVYFSKFANIYVNVQLEDLNVAVLCMGKGLSPYLHFRTYCRQIVPNQRNGAVFTQLRIYNVEVTLPNRVQ